MEKKLRVGDIMAIGSVLSNTEDILVGMSLGAKSLYNIFKLKKAIIEQYDIAQETVFSLANRYDAVPMDGGVKVPPENLESFNLNYGELLSEEVVITYDVINIPADATCGPKFMEVFFDFVTISD